jgi:alpha-glucoside transport system substrate-binding protein
VVTYPDDTTRQLGGAVVNSAVVRFDMSDLAPQLFGGSASAHEWVLLQRFLASPSDPAGTARALEAAAMKDFGGK